MVEGGGVKMVEGEVSAWWRGRCQHGGGGGVSMVEGGGVKMVEGEGVKMVDGGGVKMTEDHLCSSI
jgi:hypothetical protein